MQEEFIDIITLMACKMQLENPKLTNDEAIQASLESFYNSHIELKERLTKLKERLSKNDWKTLVEIFTSENKTPELLEASYNEKLNNNQFIDGSTIIPLRLLVEHEGTSIYHLLPAGTKVKITKDIWKQKLDFIEVWTSPKSVDYCFRENVLAY